MTNAVIDELEIEYSELKEAVTDEYTELAEFLHLKLDEKRKKPGFGVSWTKISKQRKKGGLSPRMLRVQMMKQRRRYRGRTGRKGYFLRMRPKLLRNLRKAMRAGARIKAGRHRKWTMRRSGAAIKRMKGKVEVFTGRKRFRKKTTVAVKKPKIAARGIIRKFQPKGRQKIAASIFYGVSPCLTEMFITDRVNEIINREDLLIFLAMDADIVESAIFPLAFAVAAKLDESEVRDKFFDIDIVDGSLYAFFENVEEDAYEGILKELVTIGESELIVKEGENIDENYISDFTVFTVVPDEKFIAGLIEEIVGDEKDFITECEKDFDVDDYTNLLALEKSVESGLYDNIDEDDLKIRAEDVGIKLYKSGGGFETENVDENLWEAKCDGAWVVPAGLFSMADEKKAAEVVKGVCESQEQAFDRMRFLVLQNADSNGKIIKLENIYNELLTLYN